MLWLTGCDAMEDSVRRGADDVKQSYDESRYRLADWIYRRDRGQPEAPPIPTRYCYRAQMDILCYDQPQEKLKAVLVGMQADGGPAYQPASVSVVEVSPPISATAVPMNTIAVAEIPGSVQNTPFSVGRSPSAIDTVTPPPGAVAPPVAATASVTPESAPPSAPTPLMSGM